MKLRTLVQHSVALVAAAALAACGGGGGDSTATASSFTISGTVSGLASGTQVAVTDTISGVAETLNLTQNGSFTFVKNVDAGGSYAVTATTAAGQTCTVSNAAGTGVNASVTNVRVTCSPITYTVGGAVSGLLSGQSVTLRDNNDSTTDYPVNANGTYAFSTPIAYNAGYAVTVVTQPNGATCSPSNGTGANVTSNVTNANITCAQNTVTAGGTISGLTSGQQITLTNGGDVANAVVSGNGGYSFPIAYNGGYSIVATAPTGVVCSVANPSGTNLTSAATNVNVTCSTQSFAIGGVVNNLTPGQTLTLLDNTDASDPATINPDGSFSFANKVAYSGSYSVTISGAQPSGQTCSVVNGVGSGVTADVSSVVVNCAANTYTIGGSVTGLGSDQLVLVNGGDTAHQVTTTGDVPYQFSVPVAYNGAFSVVATSPVGKTCTVSHASGNGVVANVTDVNVTCTVNNQAISGNVTGLNTGTQVTLLNNGADPTTVAASGNGHFQFVTPVAYNTPYSVTVGTQPTDEHCSVTNGSSQNTTADVTNVQVTCSTTTYHITGTVAGLASGQQVTLTDGNTGSTGSATLTADGSFDFPVPVNGSYTIAVATQPTTETCTVTNGTGTNVTAGASNVAVTCRMPMAYVTNVYDGTISQFKIGADALLTSVGSPIVTDPSATLQNAAQPNVVTVDPTGRYAYVANFQSGTIGQFTIDPLSGLLSANTVAPTVTLAAGSNPYAIAIAKDPSVSGAYYAYVTDQAHGVVLQYTINTANGTLVAMGTASQPTGATPYGVTVDPANLHVYVANRQGGTGNLGSISQYTIGQGGALAPMATAEVDTIGGTGPLFVKIAQFAAPSTTTYAYVDNFDGGTNGNGSIAQFSFDGNGALVPVAASTAVTANPYPLTISPDGLHAYFANKYTGDESGCAIDPTTGTLTCAQTATYGGAEAQYTAFDPLGRAIYVVNKNSSSGAYTYHSFLAQFTIDANGGIGYPSPLQVDTNSFGAFMITTTR